MTEYYDDCYDDCMYDDEGYWEKEEQKRVEVWQKSKDKLYTVGINIGNGLWDEITEVRHTEEDDKGAYWSEDGNTGYGDKDKFGNSYGNKIVAFKRKKDAENFLDGAKFFREFMAVNFFTEKVNDK